MDVEQRLEILTQRYNVELSLKPQRKIGSIVSIGKTTVWRMTPGLGGDIDRLLGLVESDHRQTLCCLLTKFGCSHLTIENHLKQFGFLSRLEVWSAHTLSEKQQNLRMGIYQSLLSKKRTFAWLDNLITGDEKWVLYVNIVRKHQWLRHTQQPIPTPKPDLHESKLMLCLWWGVHGIVYW